MKSALRILLLATVILLLTSAPARRHAAAVMHPVTTRVETVLAHRYPALLALRILFVRWVRLG